MDHTTRLPSRIVFFDLETVHSTSVIVEFGAILICPNTLMELRNYSTFVRPDNPSLLPPVFERRNGITRDALATAPTFADIADTVYELLHERIWAGHNISRFDCVHIRRAFSEMNRPPPEPKAIIDSLPLLTQTFGRRAGDMKMANLAKYFGLGPQTHRSLADVRMNLDVIKCCATIMLLESSFTNVSTMNSWVSPPNTPTKHHHGNGKSLLDGGSSNMEMKSTPQFASQYNKEEDHRPTSTTEMCNSVVVTNDLAQQQFVGYPQPQISSQASLCGASSDSFVVLKPHEFFIPKLTASLAPSYHGCLRIQLFHSGLPFQLSCADLKIRFGIQSESYNNSSKLKLSFVVDTSQSLCEVLQACDAIALSLFLDSASGSRSVNWEPVVVMRKDGLFNYPTIRLRIAISECGDAVVFATQVYKKETSSGIVQRLRLNEIDTKESKSLLMAGDLVDAILSLDQYDYQQSVGIGLVAKKLILHK